MSFQMAHTAMRIVAGPIHARYIHSTARTTILEVERKFNITAAGCLRTHLGITCDDDTRVQRLPNVTIGSLHFSRQQDEHINDQYFDTADSQLHNKGIWVRRRRASAPSGFPAIVEWEAKVRMGGDYLNSEFEEVCGETKVADYLKPINMYKLERVVDLDTMRQNWVAVEQEEVQSDEKMSLLSTMEVKVVVDTSTAGASIHSLPGFYLPFRHVVGELELTKIMELSGTDETDAQTKKTETRKMSRHLEEFMKRHEVLFPANPAPVGKLTAYFAWREQVEERLKQQY